MTTFSLSHFHERAQRVPGGGFNGGPKILRFGQFFVSERTGAQYYWVNRIFFARFDSQAAWLSDLRPAFGDREFFFDSVLHSMREGRWHPGWLDEDDLEACEGA